MRNVKNSVAIAIRDNDGRFLAVKRSDEDESLPGVWGLPAVSLSPGESPEEGVVRAGRQKLGVSVAVGAFIGEDETDRETYSLHLSEYEAILLDGSPTVPQPDRSVSQYVDVQFTDDHTLLFEAARRGSLCSRVFLRNAQISWE